MSRFRDAMATPILDSHRKVKRIKPAISAHYKELPTPHWANALVMLAVENKAAELKTKKK